jgi:phosphopantothenate synthetase
MFTTVEVGLIAGRHGLGEGFDYVFDSIEDVFDFAGMADDASAWLHSNVSLGTRRVFLYVTGLSAALAAFLDAWVLLKQDYARADTMLVLMHFDRETGEYRQQPWGWA